jgi:hypothetical protein
MIDYRSIHNRFQATGDHLPVAPPAPPQPIPQDVPSQYQQTQAQREYVDPNDKSANFDDGSYDERWNNPGYQGDGRQGPIHRPAAPQQNYNYQHSAPAPVQATRQQNYNVPQVNYNQQHQQPQQQQQQYNQPQQYETTPSPHRFLPPGKLSLNRSPDGFSFTFNKA